MLKKYSMLYGNPLLLFLLVMAGGSSVALLATQYYYLAPIPACALASVLLLKNFPLIAYYFMIFGIPHNDLRSSLTKMIGALLIGIVASQVIAEKKILNLNNSLTFPVISFIVINVISLIFSSYPKTSLDDIRCLSVAVIFYFLALSLITYNSLFNAIPKVIVAGISFGAILGIYGYFTNDPRYAMGIDAELKRATGGSGDPNVFSMYLLYSISFLAHYAVKSKNSVGKILSILVTSLNVFAVILTFSRGASLLLCIIVLFLLFEHRKLIQPINLGLVITGMATALSLLLILAPSSYWERNKSLSADDSSVSRRLDYIIVSMHTLSSSPLTGIFGAGPGTFPDCWEAAVLRGDVAKGSGKHIRRYAHNTYLEVLTGAGPAGFVFFVVIILVSMSSFIKAQRNMAKANKNLESSLVGAYKISFASSLMYFPMISDPYNKFFWVSLAFSQLSLCYSKLDNKKTFNETVL